MTGTLRTLFTIVVACSFCHVIGCHQPAGNPSASSTKAQGKADSYFVYFGTFTDRQSKGIYRSTMNAATGALSQPELVAQVPSPSFLALHPNHRFMYSVNEVDRFDGRHTGSISAFAIDPASGQLTLLNQAPSGGAGPTHIAIDRTGQLVLVANYAGGSVAALPIQFDGRVSDPAAVDQHRGKGTDPARQGEPHAHCVNFDPANRFALSADLGLDKVFVYHVDPRAGTIAANNPPFASVAAGSGPRHLAFGRSGREVYVTNEMACTVTAFHYDPNRGSLVEFQSISTLPEDFQGQKSTAEIMVHPSGKFLYVSNRGDANSIALFSIDRQTGKLTAVDHTSTQGRTPRSFGIDPAGTWFLAANQDTDNVVVFRIDPATGKLKPTGVNLHVPTPVCVTFLAMAR